MKIKRREMRMNKRKRDKKCNESVWKHKFNGY
jgi:hypothetical protein